MINNEKSDFGNFCTAILMSGCSSNTADTVSNDVQQVNVSYDQMNNEGIGLGICTQERCTARNT